MGLIGRGLIGRGCSEGIGITGLIDCAQAEDV